MQMNIPGSLNCFLRQFSEEIRTCRANCLAGTGLKALALVRKTLLDNGQDRSEF